MKEHNQKEKILDEEQSANTFAILKKRFEQNIHRHKAIQWLKFQHKLEESSDK